MIDDFDPHDLLQINSDGVLALSVVANFPGIALKEFPFVVVRRARQVNGLVPVGIRGKERHERRAAWVKPQHIIARIPAESIQLGASLPDFQAFESLREFRQRWQGSGLIWGPTGSVGFELVSGCNVVHEGSDLDIVVRTSSPLSADHLQLLTESDRSCSLDIQIETPHGAFAAREYLSGRKQCLLRTTDGPRLVSDPWVMRGCSERR